MNLAVSIVARTSVVLIIAVLTSFLLRRASASTRHAVWVLAIMSALLLPFPAMFAPQIALPLLPQASTTVTLFLPAFSTVRAVYVRSGADTGSLQLLRWLANTWMAVLGLLVIRSLSGLVGVRRLAKSAVPAEDGSWHKLLTELSAALSINRPARLLFANAPVSPMTWGVFRRTILLPSTAIEWSDERRRLVLAHELAHVKRNDGIVQVLSQIACSVYWFNPMIWYAAHRMRIERERACDDHVLSLGAVAADYADHLVQIVRGLRSRRSLSFAAVSIAQPSQLESRLVSILDPGARRRILSRRSSLILCALALTLTTLIGTVGVSAEPQRTRIAGAASEAAVVPPRIIESAPPSYPNYGMTLRIEGTVTLEGRVDVHGNVANLRVVKGLGYGLDEQAIAAVQTWKFAPALKDGVPVEAITQIDVDFKLPPNVGPTPGKPSTTIRIGPGVTPPAVISRVDPQYTDEARALKYEGTVVIQAAIGTDGVLKAEKVVRGLDHGLTEKAVEALEQWKFKPAMKDGKPVAVSLNIEVNFKLR